MPRAWRRELTLQWWAVVIIPILTVVLNFLAQPVIIYTQRKRYKAINGLRVLAEFFRKYETKVSVSQHEAAASVLKGIDEWRKYPNSLGSEANTAVLVGEVCALCDVEKNDLRLVDQALNFLDQRATERDRTKNEP